MANDIFIIIIIALINALFVAAEFATLRLKTKASDEQIISRIKGKSAKHIMSKPENYLTTFQFGSTISSLGLGWFGATFSVGVILSSFGNSIFGMEYSQSRLLVSILLFATISIIHIVFVGRLPRAISSKNPEKIIIALALPMRIFHIIFLPMIFISKYLSQWLADIFVGNSESSQESQLELRYLIEESSKRGVIDSEEQELLENVVDFTDTPVKQIMVPRTKISAVDINDSVETIISIFIEEGYSRLPVYDGTIDNIVGVIYGKDLLNMMANPQLIVFDDIIRLPFYIQEDEMINVLLKSMQREHHHLAIVLSEFGGVAGVVTMEDIIEEIVGDIQDEYDDEEPLLEETATNEFEIDASITIDDANEFLPKQLEESDDYKTLAGFITNNIGRFPKEGEVFILEGYEFTILVSSERRIEEVKLKLVETIGDNNDE